MKRKCRKFKEFKVNLPDFLIAMVIFLSYFVFKNNELAIFISFIILIPVFVYFKFDSRISIVYAILMLILAAISLGLRNDEKLANQLAIYAYYLLFVGVMQMIIEEVRYGRDKK